MYSDRVKIGASYQLNPDQTLITFFRTVFSVAVAFIATGVVSSGCRTSSNESNVKDSTIGTGLIAGDSAKGSGTLILLSGQAHVLRAGTWNYPFGKEKFSNDLQFYRGSKDYFFVNTFDPQGEQNKSFGWRWWNLRTGDIRPLVVGSKLYRPYRYLESGALLFKYEHFKYTEIIMQSDSGRRVEHAQSGRFLYNYAENGTYSYIDWPSIGEQESSFFSNLVPGKQMLLKMGDLKRNETVLSAATAIMQPRFVAKGKSVCYFKPGYYNAAKDEKTFLLECVDLAGGIRTYGSMRDQLKGSRLPPTIWAFEDSPFVVTHRLAPTHPDFKMSGPIEIFNALSVDKPLRYNLGPGWMLISQISARGAGVELEPYIVAINKIEKKVRVLHVPDLSLRLEASLPENLDRNSVFATYIPE